MLEGLLIIGWLGTVFGFLAYLNVREKAIDNERSKLLMHIQAPEQAIVAYARDGEEPKPLAPIALDDDEGYEALRLSREELPSD